MTLPRPVGPARLSALLILLTVVGTAGGCATALATAMWVVKGPNVAPQFRGLEERRVAVVCRPVSGLEMGSHNVAKDLARRIGDLLRQNGRKIEVIDQSKVDDWMDEYTWDEYTEVGRALEADLVVGVDLEQFGIFAGQTIYQGKANVAVKVCDAETDEVLYEAFPPQIVYPPNRVVPATEQQERDFRREFVRVVADQIGRHFYPHDPHADFAR